MFSKGEVFAQVADVERAFTAAWATLQIVSKLTGAGRYYLDLKPTDAGAMQRLVSDLRALRHNTSDLFEELRKPQVTDVLDYAAVRLGLPDATAGEFRTTSAHTVVWMLGHAAQLRLVQTGGREYLTAGERELLEGVQRTVPAWQAMQPIDGEDLSLRLRKESLTAIQRIEAALAEERAAARLAGDDGPFAIDGFRWRGISYQGVTPRAMKLLKRLWREQDHSCSFDEAAEAIYPDDDSTTRPTAPLLPPAASQATRVTSVSTITPTQVQIADWRVVM